MNDKPGKLIARGATAEVYDWTPDLILKLFYPHIDNRAVEYEARINRAVHAGGLPVPAVGDIVQVDGRQGLIYQRIHGIPMSDMFARRPWRVDHYARRMAELHVDMHANPFQADLPRQRDRLFDKISHARALPERLRGKALEALDILPDGDRLCHGDFHPMNIMISASQEIIIDWIDATLGNPLADVARTSVILLGEAGGRPGKSPLEKKFIRHFHAVYLRHYFDLMPGGEEVYRALLPVIAAGRLSENIQDLEPWLIAQAETIAQT